MAGRENYSKASAKNCLKNSIFHASIIFLSKNGFCYIFKIAKTISSWAVCRFCGVQNAKNSSSIFMEIFVKNKDFWVLEKSWLTGIQKICDLRMKLFFHRNGLPMRFLYQKMLSFIISLMRSFLKKIFQKILKKTNFSRLQVFIFGKNDAEF